jgi:hypothetical protein
VHLLPCCLQYHPMHYLLSCTQVHDDRYNDCSSIGQKCKSNGWFDDSQSVSGFEAKQCLCCR